MESGKEALGSVGAAIGSLSGAGVASEANQANTQKAAVPAPAVANSLLLQRVEALISKADTVISSDALKAKGYIEKYWPIVAGALIAATRLLH
jgi:hypothetical protein